MDGPVFNNEEEIVQAVLSQLEGSVQSQGIRLSAAAWLDLGSKDWREANDQDRAAAYQAATVTGWTDDAIKDIMRQACPHILPSIMDHTIRVLHDLAAKFPVAVEQIGPDTSDIPCQALPTKVAEEKQNG